MAHRLKILTWNDPRGLAPLAALAEAFAATPQGAGVAVEWSVHPLEGFESRSLAELSRDHDLLVIDHPHSGDASAAGCLRVITDIPDEYIGPCRESYRCPGGWLAIPIDAACHVCAYIDQVPFTEPLADWAQVIELADEVDVAIPLRGVHSLMALCTLLAQNGSPLVEGRPWPDPEFTGWAIELFRTLVARAGSTEMLRWNPIQALRALADGETAYLPLTFGYAYFQRAGVCFGLPPTLSSANRGHGGILGGTGLAISASCREPALAEALARFAGSRDVQANLWARHGQPAHRAAWALLAGHDAFYRDTRAAVDHSYVRPRCRGWNRFQTAAGNAITNGLARERKTSDIVADLRRLWRDMSETLNEDHANRLPRLARA